MSERFYTATNDIIFKSLFIENPDILKVFLSTALNIPIKDFGELTVCNTEISPKYVNDKLTRLDILVESGNKLINVEMQVAKRLDFKERTLYYWSRMYNEHIKKGNIYNNIDKCICINIINFNMFKCENYHSSFSVREDERYELLTDLMHIHFFELLKLQPLSEMSEEQRRSIDTLQLWMQLFKARNKKELELLQTMNNDVISDSVNKILILNKDDNVYESAREREDAEFDYYSGINSAIERGIEEGKAQVEKELINRWKLNGMTDDEIKNLLGK